VAAGLLISSRIAFLLSLIGFFSAYLFYNVIGLDINTLDYTYIGFNYILMSIAIGGFFLIPSPYTFSWAILLVPVVTFMTVGMEELLSLFHLSVYALPFNVVVLLFLFSIRQRKSRVTGLHPVAVQHNNPEKNLYAWSNYQNRLSRQTGFLFKLPIMGKWTVSQGHDGRYTHRADWRHAWDFVKTGPDGKTWQQDGLKLDDYYTWSKPVYPAAGGIVDSVTDGIPDNRPGDANTLNNWGNTVVIWHAVGLYTKYSHLKSGSVRFKPGDYVSPGLELAQAGNSGRSPEPHLHFQFQATPYIDSATLDYPFGYYLLEENGQRSLRSFDRPGEGQLIANLQSDALLSKVLHLVPGQVLRVTCRSGSEALKASWEVQTDPYNNSSIRDRKGRATAWFVNDGQAFYFTHYEGSRKNPLYAFFTACFRIPLIFDPEITVSDQIPLFVSAKPWLRWFQDWIAPFYIFLKTKYVLKYLSLDDPLSPEELMLRTQVSRQIADDRLDELACTVRLASNGRVSLTYPDGTIPFESIIIETGI
jgi:murein DD-endopeptidase MepM/ murein hydrolase activator NlpD